MFTPRNGLIASLAMLILFAAAPVRAGGDRVPPSQPTDFHVTGTTPDSITTAWAPSDDNVGVAGYALYRNGQKVARVSSPTKTYTFSSLQCATGYTLAVAAYDRAGNFSTQAVLSQTTSNCQPPTNTYDNTILADHPVAYWRMDTPGGSESDLTGRGHTGAYHGGQPGLTTLPDGESAVDFNGNGEYMTVPSSADFSIPTTNQLTWEAWIRPDNLQWTSSNDPDSAGYVNWMGKCQDYSPTCEWEARMYSSVNPENRCNRLSAYAFNRTAGLGSGADWQPQCNLLQAGQWLHVVGEYQTTTTPPGCKTAYPGTIDIWVNGVEWNMSYHLPTGCMSQYSITPRAGSSPPTSARRPSTAGSRARSPRSRSTTISSAGTRSARISRR